MGKQINYYMGFDEFKELVGFAIECGFVIYRHDRSNGKLQLFSGTTTDIVKPDCNWYYFYLPEDGDVFTEDRGGSIRFTHESMIHLIEAGYSCIHNDNGEKYISRNRLYITTDVLIGNKFITRSELITKAYNKLVRKVKKACTVYRDDGKMRQHESGYLFRGV